MNSKKIKRLTEASLLFILLAGIVTGLYFGLFAPKNYRDLIPAECRAVVELPYSALKGAGIPLPESLKDMNLFTDGVDSDEPVFMIVTPNEYIGIIMKTKNLAKVGKDISEGAKRGICQLPARTDGFSWTWADGGWLIAWDEEATIVLGPGSEGERDAIRQTARQMYKAGRSKSFRNSDHQSLLDDIQASTKVYVCADAIPVPLGTMIRLGLPSGISATKVVLVGKIDDETLKSGSALNFKGKLTSEDKEVIRLLEEMSNNRTISEASAANKSEHDITLSICTNGRDFTEKIKKEADGKMLLSAIGNTVNIKNILSKSDGEITIGVSNLTATLPHFAIIMQKSNEAIASGKRMGKEDIFTDGENEAIVNGNGFKKSMRNGTVYFSETDSLLYIGTRENAFSASTDKKAENHKGNIRQFMHINLEKAVSGKAEDNPLQLLGKIMPGRKNLTFHEYSDGELTIELE